MSFIHVGKRGKLRLILRNLGKESEPDIEDFIFEFKRFGLYFVNGDNHESFW